MHSSFVAKLFIIVYVGTFTVLRTSGDGFNFNNHPRRIDNVPYRPLNKNDPVLRNPGILPPPPPVQKVLGPSV